MTESEPYFIGEQGPEPIVLPPDEPDPKDVEVKCYGGIELPPMGAGNA